MENKTINPHDPAYDPKDQSSASVNPHESVPETEPELTIIKYNEAPQVDTAATTEPETQEVPAQEKKKGKKQNG